MQKTRYQKRGFVTDSTSGTIGSCFMNFRYKVLFFVICPMFRKFLDLFIYVLVIKHSICLFHVILFRKQKYMTSPLNLIMNGTSKGQEQPMGTSITPTYSNILSSIISGEMYLLNKESNSLSDL